MKHSQTIGIIAALAIIAVCFMPWVILPVRQQTITGMDATGTDFGKPGLLNIVISGAATLFFLVPRIWAKRTNVFLAAVNLAWSVRNYLLVSTCLMGECPRKQPALFLLLFFALVVQLMSFLPKIPLPQKK
jgi:hypothetical protein